MSLERRLPAAAHPYQGHFLSRLTADQRAQIIQVVGYTRETFTNQLMMLYRPLDDKEGRTRIMPVPVLPRLDT